MRLFFRKSDSICPCFTAFWFLFLGGKGVPAMAFEFNFPDVTFPTRRTEDAQLVRWQAGGQPFDAYIWWQKGYLWIEAAASTGSAPHICKGSFWALQEGRQCGRIFPLPNRPKKVSYCGAVRTPTIFMLFIQTAFPTCEVDPAQNFTLTFEKPQSQQRISIFGNTNHKYDELDQDNLGEGGCWIQTLL